MNKCILSGHLCGDPDLRTLPTGSVTTTVTLAVDRRKKETGADFLVCDAWGKTAELMCQYLHKGDKISVIGRIQVDEYTAKDGSNRHATKIVIEEIEFPPKARSEQQERPNEMTPVDDSDLPF